MFQQTIKHLCFLLLISYTVQGQQIRSFEQLEGCAVLGPNMTIEEARAKAIVNLKLGAFQKAGIGEELTSNSYYEVKKTTTQNKDKYYESSFSETRGEITFFKVKDFSQKIDENNSILVCVSAKIEVIALAVNSINKATISVNGLEQNYKNNSFLNFELSANKPHFYWIFLIDKDENYMLLYPRVVTRKNIFDIDAPIRLPQAIEEEWMLSTEQSEEKNSLLIISAVTEGKAPKPSSNFNEWANWYKSLPFESRKKQVYNFLIYN